MTSRDLLPAQGCDRDDPQTSAVTLRGLRKSFGKVAVDSLDLTVRRGELYALLGPNGAGKTTTLRMTAGLLAPDAGRISVFGIDAIADPVAAKRITAWLPDEPMLYDKLTPVEYLEFVVGCGRSNRAAQKPRLKICCVRSSCGRIAMNGAKGSHGA